MSMIAVAVGVGGAATIGGAIINANASSDAAESQGNIAKAQEAMANKALGFAVPTLGEIETLGNQVSNYKQAHSQAQSQLSVLQKQITQSYGENVIALGQQLHDQISGKDSGIVSTASSSIDRERSKLEQSLVDKLGPGALTSTAGAQALNNFNIQANQYLTSLRQDSVGKIIQNLSGLQGSQSSALSGVLGINTNLSGMLDHIQSTQGGFQTRQANAAIGAVSTTGSQYVEGLQKAKATAKLGSDIAGVGGQIIGAGIGAALKPAKVDMGQASSISENGFNGDLLNQSGVDINPSTSRNVSINDMDQSLGSTDLKFGNMEGMA